MSDADRLPSVITFQNGLRAVFDPMEHVETAALGFYVNTGSRFESAELQGISHLLEHMAFKGTQTRSARQLAEAVEDVGGNMNAYTGREVTAYHVGVLREHVSTALDVLCDVFFRSVFDPLELAREQEVVVQEIAAADDTPEDRLTDLLYARAYPDQPYGRPIAGNRDAVRSVTCDALNDYRRQYYRPERTVFVAAGAIDQTAIIEFLQQFCERREPALLLPAPAFYVGGNVYAPDPCEQLHVGISLPAPERLHRDYRAAALFTAAVGDGMSSRLFQAVREDRGLAYSVYASYGPASDTGLFTAEAACDVRQGTAVRDLMFEVLHDASRTLTERELRRAQTCARAGILGALESPGARAESAALQLLLHGLIRTPAEITAEIAAVTLEHARQAGADMLSRQPTVCLLGQERYLPEPS